MRAIKVSYVILNVLTLEPPLLNQREGAGCIRGTSTPLEGQNLQSQHLTSWEEEVGIELSHQWPMMFSVIIV